MKVIDVSGATAHYSGGRPIGVDAASFLAGLAANTILDLEVGEVTETRLGAWSALMADIRSRDIEAHRENGTLAHLDKEGDPGSGIIDLWQPSWVIVADVGEAIVMVQAWAASESDLAAWLPEAEQLVASLVVVEGRHQPAQGGDVNHDLGLHSAARHGSGCRVTTSRCSTMAARSGRGPAARRPRS